MKCPKCNADVKKTAKFCQNCGAPLSEEEAMTKGNRYGSENQFPLVDFVIGLILQVLLWIVYYGITRLQGGGMFVLLLLFSGATLLVPLVIGTRIGDEYNATGLYIVHGVIQGIFTVFPFFFIENWDSLTAIVVLCLIATAVTYAVAVRGLARDFPAEMPANKKRACYLLQGIFGFSIGTVVSIIIAILFVLITGKRKG